MLFSADISGIQNFIYNIGGKGVLKGLRARSFYLEILMESAIDEFLERLELTRCNVIYTGGGIHICFCRVPKKPRKLFIILKRN